MSAFFSSSLVLFQGVSEKLPAEVNLRVGVAVVEDHGEELSGRLQGGLLIHLVRWVCQACFQRSDFQLSGSQIRESPT